MPDLLATYLQDRDVPCPNCAYNLRDLTSDACPECGLQVALGVHLTEPKLAAFIGGLVGLAMAAGFSGLLSILAVFVTLIEGDGPPGGIFFVGMLFPFLFAMAVMLIWIRQRSRLRMCSPHLRSLFVVLCWVVPVINILVFVLSLEV